MGKGKNWSGEKFYRLTFVRPTDQKEGELIKWEAVCECGNLCYIVPNKVKRGITKSCGCLRSEVAGAKAKLQATDYTGQKYGRLTFIKPTELRSYKGAVVWEAACDCGNNACVVPYRAIAGITQSCGCLAIESIQRVGEGMRQFDPLISSARLVWRNNYPDCDFAIFFPLSQQACFYCGCQPYRVYNAGNRKVASERQRSEGDFIYNGLDRVDSTRGHTVDNVVPCCWTCNLMKRTLTLEVFINQIERIYHNTREPKCLPGQLAPSISGT
jgi:hypothetical protein